MIAVMISDKKLNQIVTEIFIRWNRINISTVFFTQSYFAVPKNIRVKCAHIFLWKFQTNESFKNPN